MKVMDNTLYTKLVSVAIAINAVQVWIQLVTLICILLKMALLGLFNKHFMQCGLIKPIQVKHEQNYCGIIFFITCRYEQTKSDCN